MCAVIATPEPRGHLLGQLVTSKLEGASAVADLEDVAPRLSAAEKVAAGAFLASHWAKVAAVPPATSRQPVGQGRAPRRIAVPGGSG